LRLQSYVNAARIRGAMKKDFNKRMLEECIHGGKVGSCPVCSLITDRDEWRSKFEIARSLAAKWAQQAQIESGEGLDPGFNHCLEVIDEQVQKRIKESQ